MFDIIKLAIETDSSRIISLFVDTTVIHNITHHGNRPEVLDELRVMGVVPRSLVPREKLQRVELGIAGLDCKACSLGVYNVLSRIEGVEQATASFHDGQAIAWIDPEKTNREALEMALKGRGVQLRLP